MPRRTTALAAALSLLPLGQPLLLASTSALATAAVVLATQAAHAQSADEFFKRGIDNHELGDLQEAIANWNKAKDINPQYADAYRKRGYAKWQLGDYQGSISDFTKAIEINPQDASAYNKRGDSKFFLSNQRGACADKKKAVSLGLQIALRGVPECTKIFERASGKTAGLSSEVIMALKDKIAEHTKLIVSNPQYVDAYYNRANTKYELKDYQGAIADFNKAIEFGPQYAYAYYNRGITKSILGHYQEAIADFGMAIEIDPKDSAAYYNRAILNMN